MALWIPNDTASEVSLLVFIDLINLLLVWLFFWLSALVLSLLPSKSGEKVKDMEEVVHQQEPAVNHHEQTVCVVCRSFLSVSTPNFHPNTCQWLSHIDLAFQTFLFLIVRFWNLSRPWAVNVPFYFLNMKNTGFRCFWFKCYKHINKIVL